MPHAQSQGARIYYEESGQGTPILFLHEFGGDGRSWDDQLRHFARSRRCIRANARGYPPSDAPDDAALYGQDFSTRDALAVLDAAGVDRAHVVGLSMGGYTALTLALRHPARLVSCTAAVAGSGSFRPTRERFVVETRAQADAFDRAGRIDAEAYGLGPARVQLANKDPLAWRRFADHLGEHPAHAAAKVLRAVVAGRPSLCDHEAALKAVELPVLLLVGDEDEPTLDINLWLKRTMPAARLAMLPGSGHLINLEEPALFNALLERFLAEVEGGRWRPRDPRARSATRTP
jgi:pimeloyl-ACP methyl ester carboxylesterase